MQKTGWDDDDDGTKVSTGPTTESARWREITKSVISLLSKWSNLNHPSKSTPSIYSYAPKWTMKLLMQGTSTEVHPIQFLVLWKDLLLLVVYIDVVGSFVERFTLFVLSIYQGLIRYWHRTKASRKFAAEVVDGNDSSVNPPNEQLRTTKTLNKHAKRPTSCGLAG